MPALARSKAYGCRTDNVQLGQAGAAVSVNLSPFYGGTPVHPIFTVPLAEKGGSPSRRVPGKTERLWATRS
jgi:hypothetical protein